MKFRNALIILGAIFIAAKTTAVEEALNPEPLRDRLIHVEESFVEHKRRMDKQDEEIASLIMRIRHLERLLVDEEPKDKVSKQKKNVREHQQRVKIKPYRYF